ncbi:MAG: hypothetical protein DGJ47_000146 [Rickettsiaceae bacterium]
MLAGDVDYSINYGSYGTIIDYSIHLDNFSMLKMVAFIVNHNILGITKSDLVFNKQKTKDYLVKQIIYAKQKQDDYCVHKAKIIIDLNLIDLSRPYGNAMSGSESVFSLILDSGDKNLALYAVNILFISSEYAMDQIESVIDSLELEKDENYYRCITLFEAVNNLSLLSAEQAQIQEISDFLYSHCQTKYIDSALLEFLVNDIEENLE